MHIQEIASCTPNLSDELLGVWERSIRATHHFLAESDIVRIRAYVSKAILNSQPECGRSRFLELR